jgi:HlyD family secretion protein
MSMSHAYVLPGDGKPQPVEVRTGLSDGTWSELLSGALKEGDEVIVGTQDTRNGAKVAPAAGPRMPF